MSGLISDFVKQTYLQWIGLGIAISVLIWVAVRIRAYFRDEADEADDKHRLLQQFRELHTEGELTEEEYRKLKSRLRLDRIGESNMYDRTRQGEGPPTAN